VVNTPVATSSWYPTLTRGSSKPATPRATATTGGLNQVKVSGVACVSTTGRFAPFPLLFPLSRPPLSSSQPTPLSPPTSTPPPPLTLLPPLSLLLSFSFTSSLLSFSSRFPPSPQSKKSYNEGNMQSGRRPSPTPWDPSKVWWHAQGRLRPRQTPAPSPISGLLDSVMTPGSGGGGEDIAVDAAQVYYHLNLIHTKVTVPAPPAVEHTADLVVINGRTVVCK
ncbi:unnamed protein product, partial [Schistocephalus solidus]|uniref:Galectin domain-containing protein n=1 Tax=Schistocephalus solidus TaxID=70667 RepID=A0A183TNL5_SCHSO